MEDIMKKRIIISCLVAFCFVFCGAIAALAQTLSLEATSDGSTLKTAFSCGDDLYLNVILNNGDNMVAGAALTINYPTAYLTAPATNTEGLPTVAGEISSAFPFTFQTVNKTHRGNSSEIGKIYLSGAAINVTNGGAVNNLSDALFTIKFKVKYGITVPQTITFTITQTQLWNPLAGYGLNNGVPVTVDRAFNAAGGDTKETVPVLVGAVNNTHADFNNLQAAFPVLLGDVAHPFTMVTYNACSVTSCAAFAKGDANGDGNITSVDALWVLYVVAGIADQGALRGNCDVNNSGTLTSVDALWILYYVSGQIVAFP